MQETTTLESTAQPFKNSNLKWVDRTSRLMDSKFKIPGTNIRFGLDPIFSLFPVAGDLATYGVSAVLIATMYRHGASQKLVIKMIINSTIDLLLGSIPLIGTIFDVFYKANNRNVRLLREHYEEGKHRGSGRGLIAITVLIVGSLVVGFVWLCWQIAEAAWQALT